MAWEVASRRFWSFLEQAQAVAEILRTEELKVRLEANFPMLCNDRVFEVRHRFPNQGNGLLRGEGVGLEAVCCTKSEF